MGDLIGSEKATSRADLHRLFNAEVDAANSQDEPSLISPLTITLGDEFQGLTSTFLGAISLIQKLRMRLLASGVECRFAIGLVRLEAPLNEKTAWNMMGQGLAETREKLNEKAENPYRFFLGPTKPMMSVLMEAVGRSLAHLEKGWTDRQKQVAVRLALGEPATELSRSLKIHIRTLYKIREAAQYDFYMGQWASLFDIAGDLDVEYRLT